MSIKFDPWLSGFVIVDILSHGAHLGDAGFKSLVSQFRFPISFIFPALLSINWQKAFKDLSKANSKTTDWGGEKEQIQKINKTLMRLISSEYEEWETEERNVIK